MRLKISIIVCAMVACIVACSAKGSGGKSNVAEKPKFCTKWYGPDSTAYKHLGRNLATVLFSPQEVKVYTVQWQDSVTPGQLEDYFTKNSLIAKLSKEEIALVQYSLLSDGRNYENDSIVVRSPYAPIIDFEFKKKKDVAHVLVSLSNFTWTVIYDDKKQFNYNFHDDALIRLCNHYLNKK